jgi:hypothetical protein
MRKKSKNQKIEKSKTTKSQRLNKGPNGDTGWPISRNTIIIQF